LTHDTSTVFARGSRSEKLGRIGVPQASTLRKAA
jgi:hypothetical protein